jgi:hypothetical protein
MYKEHKAGLHEVTIHDGKLLETAYHEALHCIIDPKNVVEVSVVPDPSINALGWTLVERMDDVTLGAGIVAGSGFGDDARQIMHNAIFRGESPIIALQNAESQARYIINSVRDGLIDLVAKGIAQRKHITGQEFQELVKEADWLLDFKEEHGHFPEPLPEETSVEIDSIAPRPTIPDQGKFTLTIYNPNGYTIQEYEDGVMVKGEVWELVEEDDDKVNALVPDLLKQYRKILDLKPMKLFIFPQPKPRVIWKTGT